jgi:subtilisin family serine protease
MAMRRRYVVLRAVGSARPRDPLSPGMGARGVTGGAPTQQRIDGAELSSADLRDLARDPDVVTIAPAMPTRLVRPLAVAHSAATTAWGVGEVGAVDTPFDGAGVDVAILDTGIDRAHEAFRGMELVERDFTGFGNGDRNGHGTHAAGTFFGRDVGGIRVGVARGVRRAMVGKVLGDDGSGTTEALFQSLSWALDQGARVIALALGFDFPGMVVKLTESGWPADLATSAGLDAYRGSLLLFEALLGMAAARRSFDGGSVFVAAAGNESRRSQDRRYEVTTSMPAASHEVVSVAALQRSPNGLGVADFSNTLADISAPGVNILSARAGGGLVAFSGTSMAGPHVAGVAALWWQALRQRPTLVDAALVSGRLLATARTGGFVPGVEVADRGVGISFAPR